MARTPRRSKLKMKASDFCVYSQVAGSFAKTFLHPNPPSSARSSERIHPDGRAHAPKEAQGRPTVYSQEGKHRMNGEEDEQTRKVL